MSLRLRFTLGFSLVISFAFTCFSFVIYAQVKQQLVASATQTLSDYMEHEWRHLEHATAIRAPSSTLRSSEIFYRIIKDGQTIYDVIPRGIEAPNEGEGVREIANGLFQRGERRIRDSRIELSAYHDLGATEGYLAALRRALILCCLLATLFLFPAALFSTRSLLTPFRALAVQTKALDARTLTFRFPENLANDEFGSLVRSFNALLERLDRSFGQMRRFATNASHELQTPLAVIRGESELLLRRKREAAEYEAGLLRIGSQAEDLQGIVRRLLFLADLERYENEPRSSEILVGLHITTMFNTLLRLQANESKHLDMEVEDEIVYVGHRELFSSIVTNLIENALKYSHERVRVQARREQTVLHLRIEDDGPGIPESRHEEVFQPLTRLEREDPKSKGHGLGLAIVRACVEAAKGSIRLSDSSLGGLKVDIALP